jgi:hypothetical protein
VTPVITDATGSLAPSLQKHLFDISGKNSSMEKKKMVILETAHVFRRFYRITIQKLLYNEPEREGLILVHRQTQQLTVSQLVLRNLLSHFRTVDELTFEL